MTGMRRQPLDAPGRLSAVVGLSHFHEVEPPALFSNFNVSLLARRSIFQDGRYAGVEVAELATVVGFPFPHGISVRRCYGISVQRCYDIDICGI